MNGTNQAPAQTSPKPKSLQGRLLSLDALRGFDMFWIVGGEELIHALAKAWPIAPLRVLEGQMNHSDWDGVTFYDLIFPFFVFIVGASLVFALGRSIERDGMKATLKHVLFRSLMLYLLGVFAYGGISKGFDQVRWLGVLQRIAICYLVAGVIFCTFRTRAIVVIWVALLLGYWALTALVPIRDFNLERQHLKSIGLEPNSAETAARFQATKERVSGKYEDGLNLTQHLDFEYLPGFRWDGTSDPEGLLSTLPAIATCLFGVFAGMLLKTESVTGQRKVLLLVIAGAVSMAAGFEWDSQFPIIKRIWTSSYVLVAGGYSCLLLGVFYQVVEIWQWRKWCLPFVWIGMNPITIYLAFHLVDFNEFANRLVGGPVQKRVGNWGELLHAAVVVALVLALVRFLYRRNVFLRL